MWNLTVCFTWLREVNHHVVIHWQITIRGETVPWINYMDQSVSWFGLDIQAELIPVTILALDWCPRHGLIYMCACVSFTFNITLGIHPMLFQCFNVGPASKTVGQHWNSVRLIRNCLHELQFPQVAFPKSSNCLYLLLCLLPFLAHTILSQLSFLRS